MFTLLFTLRKSKLKRKLFGPDCLRKSLLTFFLILFLRLFDVHFADPFN